MASPYRPQQPLPSELEITVVSAKHLKNVNWKSGDLKPYCVFWIDSSRRLSTKTDDGGSTRPVWNERFSLPLPDYPSSSSYLTLEVLHSNSSEAQKPLVGTLMVALNELPNSEDFNRIRTFELTRPSGRPQGKIRLKIGIRERPFPPPPNPHHHLQDYQFSPHHNYYYAPASAPPPPLPPPQPVHFDYNRLNSSPASSSVPMGPYAPPYLPPAAYFPSYYPSSTSAAPPPPRPSFYSGAPSAPTEAYLPYDQRPRIPDDKGTAFGANMGVGGTAGALRGLTLDDKLKYEENKGPQRTERGFTSSTPDDYSDYRSDY